MELIALQRAMAKLYTDAALRQRFYADPQSTAPALGLDSEAARYIASIDRSEVEAFAASLTRKDRAGTRNQVKRRWWKFAR